MCKIPMPLPRMKKKNEVHFLHPSTLYLCLPKTGEETLWWIQKDLTAAQVSDLQVLCLSELPAFRKSSWSVPRPEINAYNYPVTPMDNLFDLGEKYGLAHLARNLDSLWLASALYLSMVSKFEREIRMLFLGPWNPNSMESAQHILVDVRSSKTVDVLSL